MSRPQATSNLSQKFNNLLTAVYAKETIPGDVLMSALAGIPREAFLGSGILGEIATLFPSAQVGSLIKSAKLNFDQILDVATVMIRSYESHYPREIDGDSSAKISRAAQFITAVIKEIPEVFTDTKIRTSMIEELARRVSSSKERLAEQISNNDIDYIAAHRLVDGLRSFSAAEQHLDALL